MRLDLFFKDGIKESYDTEKMTSSAPGGGVAGMMGYVATYCKTESEAPFGERDVLRPGLWVHMYQYSVDKGLEANAKRRSLVGRFGIASGKRMDEALCVRRDGEVWLARVEPRGELVDFGRLNSFGQQYVQDYGKSSIIVGLQNSIPVAEALGLLPQDSTASDAAELFGLPERFVGRVLGDDFAQFAPEAEIEGRR